VAGHDCYSAFGSLGCALVRAYTIDSDLRWSDIDPQDQNSTAWGVAVGPDDSVYVVGRGVDFGWMRRYDNGGSLEWSREVSDGGFITLPRDVAVGEDGAVAVVGDEVDYGDGSWAGSGAIWVRMHDSEGNALWTDRINAGDDLTDMGYGVAVDPADGSVIVVGLVGTAWPGDDYPGRGLLRKYGPDGEVWWTRMVEDPEGMSASFDAAAVDRDGTIVVVGNYGEWANRGYASDRTAFISRYGR
jgi:hypothetical protein